MTAPAIGGPTIEASWRSPGAARWPTAAARRSSVRGRNACWAGMYRASAAPNTAPSSASSGIDAVSDRTSAAMRADDRPADQVRGEHQRPRRPAVGEDAERDAAGPRAARAIAMSTAPSARPEPVSEITSHDRATKWNWSPTTRDRLARPQQAEVAGVEGAQERQRPDAAGAMAVIRGRSARRRRRRRPRGRVRGSRSGAPRGRGDTCSAGRPGMRSRASLPTAMRQPEVDDRPAGVADLDAEGAGAVALAAGRRCRRSPPRRRRVGAEAAGRLGSRTAAARPGRPAGAGRALVERGEDRAPPRRRSGVPRRRGGGPRRAGRRPSAPPPEVARPGLLEDLEPVGGATRCRGRHARARAGSRAGRPRGGRCAPPPATASASGPEAAGERRPRRPARRRRRVGPPTGGRGGRGLGLGDDHDRRRRARPAARVPAGRRGRHGRRGHGRASERPASAAQPDVARGRPDRRRPRIPSPTTSVRRPRPPSVRWVPLARTSPAIDWVSRRTALGVVSSTSPLTELIAWSAPSPSSASTRTSPLVVDAARTSNRRPRERSGRRTPSGPGARSARLASTSTSPDIDSTVTGPPSTWRRTSPDAVAQRLAPATPVASTSPLIVRSAIVARARDLDLEVGRLVGCAAGTARAGSRRRCRASGPCPAAASIVKSSSSVLAAEAADGDDVALDAAHQDAAGGERGCSTSPPGSSGSSRAVGAWRGRAGHRTVLPSARMASAASSALSSWLASRSRTSRRPACDVLGGGGRVERRRRARPPRRWMGVVRLVARAEAEGADERLDPGPDGGVADAELALHVAEVAAAAEEALEHLGLLAGQAGEPADAELALDASSRSRRTEGG